jgi:ABC-type Mn2+/Zn2+ transport system ATPase subunit
MKIENINIDHQGVSLKNVALSFENTGIYTLHGENGSGKTSLIEEILFENHAAKFESPCQAQSYVQRSRYKLIAYVPQNIISIDLPIREYITRGAVKMSDGEIMSVLDKWGMPHMDLGQRFHTLSGGEKTKIAIISAIAKDTPYLVLDEPTNHLDDAAVKCFILAMGELAESKTIIVASHDPRLVFEQSAKIFIDGNKVYLSNESAAPLDATPNLRPPSRIRTNHINTLRSFLFNRSNLLSVCISLIVLTLLGAYMQIEFMMNYASNEAPQKNSIMTYAADYAFDELNKTYCAEEGLQIQGATAYNYISFNDIPDIAATDGVKDVIMYDYAYMDRIAWDFVSDQLISQQYKIAAPIEIYKYYPSVFSLPFDFNILESGEFPQDGQFEICTSKRVLKKYFGFDEGNLRTPIGSMVQIDGQKYEIVGISPYDIQFLSYDANSHYGFEPYAAGAYGDFVARNKQAKTNNDMLYPDSADYLLIKTKEGFEKKILDKLMLNYPAANYISNHFTEVWNKAINEKARFKTFIINAVIAGFVGLLLLLVNINLYKTAITRLADMENYFLYKRRLRVSFAIVSVSQYVAIGLVASIIARAINSSGGLISSLLWFDSAVFAIPGIVYYIAKAFFGKKHELR